MGTVRDLWPWEPVSEEWLIRLEGLKPDFAIQRAAAIEYLERHKADVKPCRIPASLPFIMAAVAFGLFVLTVAFAR